MLIQSYPPGAGKCLELLRDLILETATEIDGVEILDETLKWGEPSYVAKHGSTVRMDWKPSDPGHVAMYFHCRTALVETFRELYGNMFLFEGNRAIRFKIGEKIPVSELKHCIALSLTYRKRKHLPMLGA